MRALLILTIVLLTACTTLPERPVPADVAAAWHERQSALARMGVWDLRGRIAVRAPRQGGQASVHWARTPPVHVIDLAGPFGGGRVQLRQDASGASLRDSAQREYRAKD